MCGSCGGTIKHGQKSATAGARKGSDHVGGYSTTTRTDAVAPERDVVLTRSAFPFLGASSRVPPAYRDASVAPLALVFALTPLLPVSRPHESMTGILLA